jgi:hypothetical protein
MHLGFANHLNNAMVGLSKFQFISHNVEACAGITPLLAQ